MSDFVYLPSAVKHFRRLAEEWRREAKQIRKEIRSKRAEAKAGSIPFSEMQTEYYCAIARAELYEKLGKELKEMASDVLNYRTPIL